MYPLSWPNILIVILGIIVIAVAIYFVVIWIRKSIKRTVTEEVSQQQAKASDQPGPGSGF